MPRPSVRSSRLVWGANGLGGFSKCFLGESGMKCLRVLLAFLIVFSTVAVLAYDDHANYVKNGDFKDGFNGWSELKEGDIGRAKAYSIRIVKDGSADDSDIAVLENAKDVKGVYAYAWFSQDVKLKKGAIYKLSFSARGENAGKEQGVHIKWPGEQFFDFKYKIETSDWKRHDFFFFAKANSMSLSFVMLGSGSLKFKDIQITDANLPEGHLLKHGIIFSPASRGIDEADKASYAPSPDEARAKYVVYKRMNPRYIFENSVPSNNEVANRVDVVMTPGESTSTWFSIYAIEDLGDVKVSLSAPESADGLCKFDGNCIETRVMTYRDKRTGWISTSYYRIPELLEDYSILPVKAKRSQTYWFTIKAPEDVPAKTFTAAITIRPDRGESKTIPLSIKVLPFKLESPKDRFWIMWMSDFGYDKMSDALFARQLADIKGHGVESIILYPPGLGDCSFRDDGRGGVIYDSPQLDRLLKTWKSAGMTGPLLLNWGGVHEELVAKDLMGLKGAMTEKWMLSSSIRSLFEKKMKDSFIAMDRFIKNHGVEDWYYMGMDEPGVHRQRIPRCLLELNCAAAAGVKTWIDIDDEHGDLVACDLKSSPVACWSGAPATAEAADKRKSIGRGNWWYGTGVYDGQEGGLMPNRYYSGIIFYKSGATGQMSWSYQRIGVTGDPFDDFDGNGYPEPKDAYIAYPSRDGEGVIPTLQWEGVREGINDYKYIYTLEKAIARKKEDPATRAKAEEAERRMNGIIQACEWRCANSSLSDPKTQFLKNEEAQAVRDEVISIMLGLR